MNSIQIVRPRPIAALAGFIPAARLEATEVDLERLRRSLNGRRVVNVTGDDRFKGGVYEILRTALPYLAGAGIDVAWFNVETATGARAALERAHVLGHGPGPSENDRLSRLTDELARFGSQGREALTPRLRPSDIALLHDTQTALLVPPVRQLTAGVVWHAHIGTDDQDAAAPYWSIFGPKVLAADRCIFYFADYIPHILKARGVTIRPGVDPSSAKNAPLAATTARAALRTLPPDLVSVQAGGELALMDTALVACQVSRWDPLKDMAGVVDALGRVVAEDARFHGLVVGTLAQSESERQQLRLSLEAHARIVDRARQRVHIVTVDASGSTGHDQAIRAFQAAADIAIQKSIREGFGLTVTEAMLRGKAVVASRVGGIPHQIAHGVSGLLLDDPTDIETCAALILSLSSGTRRNSIGTAAASASSVFGTIERYVGELARCLLEVAES